MSRTRAALLVGTCLLLAGCTAATATATEAASAPGPSATRSATPQTTARPTPSASPTAVVVAVRLANGVITPPTGRVAVHLGSPVVIRFTSDIADTVHVHGYDIEQPVKAGIPTDIAFTADLQGTFEVETHDTTMVLTLIQVS